ncbi:MAG: PEP-CTERM sorting domain-containing protein [Fischerella sp.]|nr:PEP-CTERM sorting domain-containing protein [Fischerella sp.]
MTAFQIAKKLGKPDPRATLNKFQIGKKLLKTTNVATFTAVVVGMVSLGKAGAVVIGFDDLPESRVAINNGYAGLNWHNFYYLNTSTYEYNPSGYANGTVSGSNVAYNAFANPAAVSIDSGAFDFNSAYLTGAWNDDLNILVEGFLEGELKYSRTVTVDTKAPQEFQFNFLGIDFLRFTSLNSGTPAGYQGKGYHFAMDNFNYNKTKSVPEPFTILGSLTAGSLGLALHRKYKHKEQQK